MATRIHVFGARITADVGRFVKGLDKARAATRKMGQAWGSAATSVSSAANRIGLAASIIGGTVVKKFADFESQITRVGAVTETLGKGSEKQFNILRNAALKAGETTRFTATQSAEAIEKLGLAGLSVAEITGGALKGALQLATAAQIDIGTAADIAAKQMRAFGLEASDLGRINDTLVATQARANTSILQLAEALKPVAPIAAQQNVSLELTAAILAKMADAGFQGGIAGVALRRAFINMTGPTKQTAEALKRMGIDSLDPLLVKLQKVEFAIADAENETEQLSIATEIFGARAAGPMIAALSAGTLSIEDFAKELEKAGGIAARIEAAQLNTLTGQFAILRSAIEGVQLAVGGELNPALRATIENLRAFIDANRPQIVMALRDALQAVIGSFQVLSQFALDNAGTFLQLAQSMADVITQVTQFLADHPSLLAALIALKITGILGVNSAVIAMGSALGQTMMLLTQFKILAATTGGAQGVGLLAKSILALKGLFIITATVAIVKLIAATGLLGKAVTNSNEAIQAQNDLLNKNISLMKKQAAEALKAAGEQPTKKGKVEATEEEVERLKRASQAADKAVINAKKLLADQKKGFLNRVRNARDSLLASGETLLEFYERQAKDLKKNSDAIAAALKAAQEQLASVEEPAGPIAAPVPSDLARRAAARGKKGGGTDGPPIKAPIPKEAQKAIEKEIAEKKRRAEQAARVEKDLTTQLGDLRGMSAASALASAEELAASVRSVANQFRLGTLNADQFAEATAQLSQQIAEATKQERLARIARLVSGKGTAGDKAFLQQQIAERREQLRQAALMQRFSSIVNVAAGGAQSLNRGFRRLVPQLNKFGVGLNRTIQRAQPSGQQVSKLFSQLSSVFSSRQGMAMLVRNQISLLRQNLTVLDTYRQQRNVMRQIESRMRLLNQLLQPIQPAIVASRLGFGGIVDPGLQRRQPSRARDSAGGGGGINVTINTSATGGAQLVRELELELQRRGRRI